MSRFDERPLLDTVRWISALMVFWGHAWAGLFGHPTTFIGQVLWTLAETRHEWVTLFFVLSGYLVGGGTLVRSDRFSFKPYVVARFSRIYIVLIPALLLTAGLDGLAFHLDPHSLVHAGPWADGLFGGTPPFANYDAKHVVLSLLSLEPFMHSAAMGSDGPLWTLGFEWVFYLAFPPLMLAADWVAKRGLGGRVWLARGILLVVSAAVLAVQHMPYVTLLWLIWVAGAATHVVARTDRWPVVLRWVGLVVCVAGFVLLPRIGYRFADALIGFGFAAFLARFPVGERGLDRRLDKALASASYSLYVIHLPVVCFLDLLFIRAGWLHSGGEPLAAAGLGMLAVTIAVVFAVAGVFYLLFERNTNRLRRFLMTARLPLAARPVMAEGER